VDNKKLLVMMLLLCTMFMTGCYKGSDYAEIFERYYLTTLNISDSSSVMSAIRDDEGAELISQSESVVASWGQKKGTAILWFNAVAFNEDELTAVRKYGFVADEKAKGSKLLNIDVLKLRFDAELIIGSGVLEAPYANNNALKIAVLREVVTKFKGDLSQITGDSQVLDSSLALVQQVLGQILYRLDHSPALAARMEEMSGMKFDHMNFGEGRIRMLIEENIVKVKIKVGSVVDDFESHLDVITM
jgi:hypothetical protein